MTSCHSVDFDSINLPSSSILTVGVCGWTAATVLVIANSSSNGLGLQNGHGGRAQRLRPDLHILGCLHRVNYRFNARVTDRPLSGTPRPVRAAGTGHGGHLLRRRGARGGAGAGAGRGSAPDRGGLVADAAAEPPCAGIRGTLWKIVAPGRLDPGRRILRPGFAAHEVG